VLAGEGGAGGDEVGGCALEDDPATVVAGAGSEVDDSVLVAELIVSPIWYGAAIAVSVCVAWLDRPVEEP
jgi:hypothetical protein